ncbi:MAG: hypothetical protein ABFD89_17685 [Bryobacteraceae bacterium]
MTDPVRTFIDAVHVKLSALQGVTIPAVILAKNWNENVAKPVVKWKYGRVSHEKTTTAKIVDADIGGEVQVLTICVWAVDEDACRVIKNNLWRAMRAVSGGPNIEMGEWDWITENKPGWMNDGAALQGASKVHLAVPIVDGGRTNRKALITSQTHTEELTQQVAEEPVP